MRLFETSRQAPLFLVFFLLGVCLGAVYEIFGLFRNRKTLSLISDIVFAGLFILGTGTCAYFFNSGEIKLYFYFAELLGAVTEHKTLGVFIKIFIDFLRKILYNLSIIFK